MAPTEWPPKCLPAYLLNCLLACLLACLLVCLLACLFVLEPPGFFRMLLELIFNVLLRNVTHARIHDIASTWAPVGAKNWHPILQLALAALPPFIPWRNLIYQSIQNFCLCCLLCMRRARARPRRLSWAMQKAQMPRQNFRLRQAPCVSDQIDEP